MILHLLRLMWKVKKRNALLAFQLFIGFLLIFVLVTLGIHNINKYNQPLGFQYIDRLNFQISTRGNKEKYMQIYNHLASIRGIKVSSVVSSVPYFPASGASTLKSEITGLMVNTEELHVDLAYKDVMELTMAEGRWFNELDLLLKSPPVIISPAYDKAYYGTKDAPVSEITGVLKNFRRFGEFDDETISRIRLITPENGNSIIVKVPKGSGIEMEEQLVKTIKAIAPDVLIKVTHLEDKRAEYLQKKLTPLLVIAGISIFLFINVILGLFGVLWYSISLRTTEIGVRRAMGATAKNVTLQFVTEMLILASMGIIPGIVIATQIQILNLLKTDSVVYLLSLILTTVLIYLLVSLCALIPGIKSVRMKPSEAIANE
jgi:putative ABC transport system permease protein